MLKRVGGLVGSGVRFIALLALNDDGAPMYDRRIAEALAGFGIPAFACSPDRFPDLMAVAIGGRDIGKWSEEVSN